MCAPQRSFGAALFDGCHSGCRCDGLCGNADSPWGDRLERSGWLPIVMQWARLMTPPMSAWLRTVVLFWSGEKMYICLVYTWRMSFETAPVTGSLVSVTANLRMAGFAWAICGTQSSLEMATGCQQAGPVLISRFSWTCRGMPRRRLLIWILRGSMNWTSRACRTCWA